MRTRILVLNDDPNILAGLTKGLDSEGFAVSGRLGYVVTIVDVTEIHPQLIILDVDADSESRGIEFMQVVWLAPALGMGRFWSSGPNCAARSHHCRRGQYAKQRKNRCRRGG